MLPEFDIPLLGGQGHTGGQTPLQHIEAILRQYAEKSLKRWNRAK